MEIEICCGDIESVIGAAKGGAKRIELCCALADGGLTPSLGLIREAVKTGIPKINVLIRPRPGDFVYSPEELKVMADDIDAAIDNGATGIVIGALLPDGNIDMEAMRMLIGHVKEKSKEKNKKIGVTFHRAFDVARDPQQALQDVLTLGCDCLLTSGMANSAKDGIPVLQNLVKKADGRLQIMAGSGVSTANASAIAEATAVGAMHASARKRVESSMKFRRNDVAMGKSPDEEYHRMVTDPEIVKELHKILVK